MAFGFSTPVRNGCAQVRADAIDGGAGPGLLPVYSGGRPDTCRDISSLVAHAINTAYTAGDYATGGGHYYRADNSGTSSGSAPTFPTDGSTVIDNDITWQDMGEIPVLLGTLTFSDPCGTVSGGTLTFSAIAEDSSADATAVATWGRGTDSDGVAVVDMDIGLIGSGAQIEMNTTSIVELGPIQATAGSITEGNA